MTTALLVQPNYNDDPKIFREQVNNLVIQCKNIRTLIAETYAQILSVAGANNSADKDYDKGSADRMKELESFCYDLLSVVHLAV